MNYNLSLPTVSRIIIVPCLILVIDDHADHDTVEEFLQLICFYCGKSCQPFRNSFLPNNKLKLFSIIRKFILLRGLLEYCPKKLPVLLKNCQILIEAF